MTDQQKQQLRIDVAKDVIESLDLIKPKSMIYIEKIYDNTLGIEEIESEDSKVIAQGQLFYLLYLLIMNLIFQNIDKKVLFLKVL